MSTVDLTVQLAPRNQRGLLLANPVMTASGTFGYGMEYSEIVDIHRLGAIICKGTTLEPRRGNPQPRMVETEWGVLNSIGMENIGVEALIQEKAPLWATWSVPVIVNILGDTVAEYSELAARLDQVSGVSAVELNLSCPNVKAGGAEFGSRAAGAAEVTAAARKSTSLPLMVKLSPNSSDIASIARAVVDAGADALTLTNTLKGMAIDIGSRKPILGNCYGGLSGPAIKPVALGVVYGTAKHVHVPIIGCGGISSASDALEFIMAGATAVQVGTATFVNPGTAIEVIDGLQAFATREGLRSISELVGAAA